jgi:hypothetical protein
MEGPLLLLGKLLIEHPFMPRQSTEHEILSNPERNNLSETKDMSR